MLPDLPTLTLADLVTIWGTSRHLQQAAAIVAVLIAAVAWGALRTPRP